MPPKPQHKKVKEQKGAVFAYGSWTNEVKNLEVNDKDWSCFIAFLAPKESIYLGVLDDMNQSILDGKRIHVKTISRRTIIDAVQTHCGKTGLRSPYSALCDEIKKNVGLYFEEQIPSDLAACLVKYIILDIKQRDVRRRRKEKQRNDDKTALLEQLKEHGEKKKSGKATEKGKKKDIPKTVKNAEKEKGKETTKGKKGKSGKDDSLGKVDTRLNKRSEDKVEPYPIEDYPLSSPSVFILISDLDASDVVRDLLEIGVPLNMVIDIGFQNDEDEEIPPALSNMLGDYTYNVLSTVRLYHRKKIMPASVIERKEAFISEFWTSFINEFWGSETCNLYRNVLLSSYSPEFLSDCEEVPEAAGNRMFDDVCQIMYDYTNMCEIYKHFISDSEIVEIPLQLPVEVKSMEWYQNVMNAVDPETVDVPFVLDTLIAQVCLLNEEEYGYNLFDYIPELRGKEEEIPEEEEVFEEDKENCVEGMIKSLNLEHELFVIEVVNQRHKEMIKPMVFPFGDSLFAKTYKNGDRRRLVRERSEHVLEYFIAGYVWAVIPSVASVEKDLYLVHFDLIKDSIPLKDRVKVAEILVTLRQLDVFDEGSAERTRVNVLQLKNKAISLDTTPDMKKASIGVLTHIPRCSYVKCKDVTDLLDTNQSTGVLVNKINFIENMGPVILSQQLLNSEMNLSRLEKIYSPLSDAMVLRFEEDTFCVNWEAFLPTTVSLRDFIQYEVDVYPKWTKWWLDELNRPEPEPEDIFRDVKVFPIFDPISPIKVDEDVIIDSFEWTMPGSLEYKKIQGLGLSDQERTIFRRFHPDLARHFSYDYYEDANLREDIVLYNLEDQRRKYFCGTSYNYRMGDDLSLRFDFLTPLYEIEQLGVFIKKSDVSFNYHTKLLPSTDEPMLNVLLDYGLVMLFSQENTIIGDLPGEVGSTEFVGEGEFDYLETKQDFDYTSLETSFFLKMSLPNGFRFVTVRLDDGLVLKQWYEVNDSVEKCRYTLKDGTVLRFLVNDTLEILYPCGDIITVYDFVAEKRQSDMGSGDGSSVSQPQESYLNYRQVYSNGKVERVVNGVAMEEESLFARECYDPFKNEHLTERADGTEIRILSTADRIVSFPDGTKIKSKVHVTMEDFFLDWDEFDLEEWFTDEESAESSIKCESVKSASFQSASFKWLPSDLGVYSPLGSLATLQVGSWIKPEDQSPEIRTPKKNHKIYTYGDGFVVYEMSFEIEHPSFARVSVRPEDPGTRIEMVGDISGFIFDDGTYDIQFGEVTNVKVIKDKFIIYTLEGDKMTDETLILFHALKSEGTLPSPPLPIVWSRNSNKEELILDTKSNVYTQRMVGAEDDEDDVNQKRYFFVRRNLTGFEMIPNEVYEKFKKEICIRKDAVFQQYDNIPFVDHLILKPFKPPEERWVMPVQSRERTLVDDLPSTYGQDWLFPFKEKEKKPAETPQLLEVRLLQRLICLNHHNKLQEILKNYVERAKMMLQGISLPAPCTCVKPPTIWAELAGTRGETDMGQLFYNQGQIVLRNPGPEFMAYLRKYVLEGSAKRALFRGKKERLFEDFKVHRTAYANRNVPNYFNSCFGTAYNAVNSIINKVAEAVDTRLEELECLLEKPIETLSDQDVHDVIKLLMSVSHPYWSALPGSGFSVEDVVEAGLQLKDQFPSMKDVLLFHGKSHEKEGAESIENILDRVIESEDGFIDEDDEDFELEECQEYISDEL